jgi:hypothetical protein
MPRENQTPEKQKKTVLNSMHKNLPDQKGDAPQEAAGRQLAVMDKVKKAKARVKASMLNRFTQAEKWHKSAADWPLKRLARINRLEQVAGDLIAIQAKAIGNGYELVRYAVTQVDDIAEEILTRAETHLAA